MTIIPSFQSPTAKAIDEALVRDQDARHMLVLRCSAMGAECDRALWYALNWTHPPERYEPRILRIFANGHAREAAMIAMLRSAGITVEGGQDTVTFLDGWLTGHVDGVVIGVPEAPATRHLLEIKTMNDQRWNTWRKKGVKASDPKYWTQMQLYMMGLGLTRGLFMAENQNTKELEVERIEYDAAHALASLSRAELIFRSDEPPARLSDDPGNWICRRCPAHGVCHGGERPLRNCRTCLASTRIGSEVRCTRHNRNLSLNDELAGCAVHLFNPALIDGKAVDADENAGTVTYAMRDGSTYIDGVRAA